MHLQIPRGAHSEFNGAVTQRCSELVAFNPHAKCWQRPGRCRQGGKTHRCHLSPHARALLLAGLGALMSPSPPGSGQGWCLGPCQVLLDRTFEAPKPLVSYKLHLGVCSEFLCSEDIRQPLCDSIKARAALLQLGGATNGCWLSAHGFYPRQQRSGLAETPSHALWLTQGKHGEGSPEQGDVSQVTQGGRGELHLSQTVHHLCSHKLRFLLAHRCANTVRIARFCSQPLNRSEMSHNQHNWTMTGLQTPLRSCKEGGPAVKKDYKGAEPPRGKGSKCNHQ